MTNQTNAASITQPPFRREERYYVLKISDMRKYLSREKFELVGTIAEKLNAGRAVDGKTTLQAVVVEHDWPEYELVWQMIADRMQGDAKRKELEPLRKCPFCGAKAMHMGGGSSRNGRVPYQVQCASRLCSASTGAHASKESATLTWNQRADKGGAL